MKKIFVIVFLLSAMMCTAINAQNESLTDSVQNHINIKLVTIGPGDELTSWWGHTALIVEDLKTRKTQFYNYGLFSFEDDNFIVNFVMGRLIFWVGAWKTPNALAYYRGLDRDIRFQILNLSPQKSMEIKKFLENNVLPENARYLYDHYYDNCSTRIRDIIDQAANGNLKKIANKKSRMTLREHTRRHTYHNPLMDFILMFLMNDSIDKDITIWDDMFLPSEMEMVVDRLQYPAENGEMTKMVKDKLVYYESKTIPPVPEKAPAHWPFTLLFGLFLGVAAIWFVYMENEKLFYVYSLVIGLIFGIMGTLLFLVASFTDHTVAYYNENLFFANPFTLMIFITSIIVLKNKQKYFSVFYYNWLLVGALGIIGVVIKLFPIFDQNNLQTITLFLPVLIGSFLAAFMIKKEM